jgi:hypothetical protein
MEVDFQKKVGSPCTVNFQAPQCSVLKKIKDRHDSHGFGKRSTDIINYQKMKQTKSII